MPDKGIEAMLTTCQVSRVVAAGFLSLAATLLTLLAPARRAAELQADVIIVGAGISGLSAALEAARGGARVLVVDMASVFGGHAVMSEGELSIIGTPLQQSRNIRDNPDLAYQDFIEWGEDANADWVRYYVSNSRLEIYDWVTAMGVKFETLRQSPGNSVPRGHVPQGRGLGLVSPLYRECVTHHGITFIWNTQVTGLIAKRGRIVGARSKNLRTGETRSLRAPAVILATGGFQSNLALLREYWPKNLTFPERILIGSGVNSVGSGHTMAKQVGAVFYNMDHQWNYPWGLTDPRYPGRGRGLSARNSAGIWVNAQGQRFVNEVITPKLALPAVLNQKPATYWLVFDEAMKRYFRVAGSDWGNFSTIQRVLFDNPEVMKTAATLEELAASAGLPATTLVETVRHYNDLVAKDDDADFQRFGPNRPPNKLFTANALPPQKIEQPPFYAAQFFPITRKSMGGVLVDRSCRALDARKRPIPGLYAVGELTGLVGINGKAGLEGTFLGPSIDQSTTDTERSGQQCKPVVV
jgi:flavocytochrome c